MSIYLKDLLKEYKGCYIYNGLESMVIGDAYMNNSDTLKKIKCSKYDDNADKYHAIQAIYNQKFNEMIIFYGNVGCGYNNQVKVFCIYDYLPEHKLTNRQILKKSLGINIYTKKFIFDICEYKMLKERDYL